MGFTLPFEKWMQGKLRGEISAVLKTRSVSSVGLNAEAVQRGLAQISAERRERWVGRGRGRCMCWSRWCEINGVG